MIKRLSIMMMLFCAAAVVGCSSAEKENAGQQAVQTRDRAFHKRFDDPVINLVVYNGWTHFHEGRYENALNDFDRLMATGNTHYDVSFGAGMSCYLLKNYSRAVYYFSRCLSQKESHFEALFYRGVSYRCSGDGIKAKKDFERISALDFSDNFFCGTQPSDIASSALLEMRKSDAAKQIGEMK